MNQHEMSCSLLLSTFKQLLLMLSLIAFVVIFASCKPAAAPSAISPLPTPSTSLPVSTPFQTSLPPDIAKKLTPSFTILITPAPPVFRPEPYNTPAGAGNIGHMLPLFFVHQINVTNAWFEDIAGGAMRIYVFAGSEPGPGGEITQQGLVIVQVAKMSPQGDISVVYEEEFRTPTQSGPVSVTSAVSERLILQSTNGTTLYFDVPSRQFVPSLSVIVPTATISISPVATPAP